MNKRDRHRANLKKFPPPGIGGGSHPYLMTCANSAKNAGRSSDQAFQEIREAIPPGRKLIRDSEIRDAIKNAYKQNLQIPPRKQNTPEPDFNAFVTGYDSDIQVLINSSRSLLNGDYRDALLLLDTLYGPEESLFIGNQYGQGVRKVSEWKPYIEGSAPALVNLPHLIPNPLSGDLGLTKSGNKSMRCDDCVADFRFAVVEFDNRPQEEQVAFWLAAIDKSWPVAAVIHSGGKSLHGWLAVKCNDCADWEQSIEQRLFPKLLVPMGCDRACRNESRLSRLPGHFRTEKGNWQRLLYLNPEVF